MKQILKNNPPSWDEILSLYQDMVYRLALSMTKNAADAEDVFQEVFLRLVRKNPNFESEEHRKAWLIRTTINCCNSLWTSAWKRRIVSLDECEAMTAETETEEHGLLEQVNALPAKYRAVIHLFYYEDMSLQAISETLNISYDAAAKRLSRARNLLKKDEGRSCTCRTFAGNITMK